MVSFESLLPSMGLGIFSVTPVVTVGLPGCSSRCSLTVGGSCSGDCWLLCWLRAELGGISCVASPRSLFLPVGPGISCVVPVLFVGLVGGSCGYFLATYGYSQWLRADCWLFLTPGGFALTWLTAWIFQGWISNLARNCWSCWMRLSLRILQ